MSNTSKAHTHTAYAFSRHGRTHGRMLACGTGRIDRERNIAHIVMRTTPIIGYTGYIVLSPMGAPPPVPQPPRPGAAGDEDDEAEE